MTYLYKCDNEECKNFDKIIKINKMLKDSDRHEGCVVCARDMIRVYSVSVKTADGFKK